MPSTRAATAALSVLALSLAACGGSGDTLSDTSRGPTLSRGELASRGSAICRDLAKRSEAVREPTGVDTAAIADYLGRVAPFTEQLERRLRELEPADDVRPAWDALTATVAETTATFREIDAKAKADDDAGAAQAARRLDALQAETLAAARKIGVTGCG